MIYQLAPGLYYGDTKEEVEFIEDLRAVYRRCQLQLFWAAVQIVAMYTLVADCCDCFGQRAETLDLEWVLRNDPPRR